MLAQITFECIFLLLLYFSDPAQVKMITNVLEIMKKMVIVNTNYKWATITIIASNDNGDDHHHKQC